MTVEELITELSAHTPTARLVIECSDEEFTIAEVVRVYDAVTIRLETDHAEED